MLSINNEYYNIDLYNMMLELRNDIYVRTKRSLFKHIGYNRLNNVKVTCPMHKRGQENHPSCYISEDGKVHCFTCNYTSDIYTMISEFLFEKRDGGISGKSYLKDKYGLSPDIQRQLTIDNILSSSGNRYRRNLEITKKIVSEQELEKYRFIHPYLYERGMTDAIIEKFDLGFDNNYMHYNVIIPCITFPVRDVEGDVITVLRRAIKNKRFFIEKGIDKPIYGIYEIKKVKAQPVFIVESVFNCLTLWSWGYEAVALLGLGNSKQFDILNKLPNRIFYIVLDGDDAGRNASIKMQRKLFNKIVYNIEMYENRDVNDLSYTEFERLMKECKNVRR